MLVSPVGGNATTLTLRVARPYSPQPLLAYLGVRSMAGVEEVSGSCYRRVVCVDGEPHLLAVDFSRAEAEGEIFASCHPGHRLPVSSLRRMVKGLVDADAPVVEIARRLEEDRVLAPLVQSHRGARIPGTVDPFELAVRAILGQQISVAAARTIAGRVAAHWGMKLEGGDAKTGFSFPGPEQLADAPLEQAGLSRGRACAIRDLAIAASGGRIDLRPDRGDLEQTESTLLSIKGIGPWTVAYISLRGLRNRDAIPVGDLGLRQALGDGKAALDTRRLAERADAWRPWRGYGAVHLWNTFLAI